jgi:hypothetical protein
LVESIILTVFFPHIIKENIEKRILLTKVCAILLMFIGIYMINR